MLWWLTLVCAVALTCVCLSVLIHRQWADHEKLVYPMITPILEMTEQASTGVRLLPEFMKGKAFWTGSGIVAVIFGWNMVPWFYPQVPPIPVGKWNYLFFSKHYPPLFLNLSIFVLFFSYFASLEVLLSVWFFDVLYVLQGGLLNRLGMGATSPHYAFGSFRYQTTGAFVALVLWWCWISRHHLRDVLRRAFGTDRSADDDHRELLSYRWATIGLFAGGLYTAGWLACLGVELRLIALFLPAMAIIMLGASKIVVDTGLVFTKPPSSSWDLAVAALGGRRNLAASTNATLSMAWFPDTHNPLRARGFIAMPMAHINRLADHISGGKRRLFWSVGAAFMVGSTASTFYNVWLGYRVGAYNFRPNWMIIRMGPWQYQNAVSEILSPTPVESADLWFFLAGAAGMILLNAMRYRFRWWPFHPVGFAMSGVSLTRNTSTTLFLAWAAKSLIIRIAGPAFYRQSKPFFVGMLIAYILAAAIGVVVDSIWFPQQGHSVHQWF